LWGYFDLVLLMDCFSDVIFVVPLLGTGFSEEVLKEQCKILSSKVIPTPKVLRSYSNTSIMHTFLVASGVQANALNFFFQPYYRYISGKSTADVWFEPSEVIVVFVLC